MFSAPKPQKTVIFDAAATQQQQAQQSVIRSRKRAGSALDLLAGSQPRTSPSELYVHTATGA